MHANAYKHMHKHTNAYAQTHTQTNTKAHTLADQGVSMFVFCAYELDNNVVIGYESHQCAYPRCLASTRLNAEKESN